MDNMLLCAFCIFNFVPANIVQVFRTNEASVRLWRGLGFKELAVVPKAGRLKGIEGLASIHIINTN